MNILVCMKTVPATTSVQVDGQFRLKRDGVKLQWNIADEAALEAALELGGTVTVLTMGPGKLEEPLRELLARGADRAVLLTDPQMAGSDTLATARALAAAVKTLGQFDLILCGRRAIDGETGQVPGMLAAMLDIPCISSVESIDQEGPLFRRLENGVQTLKTSLPAVVSICEYTYTLRLPGILGMRRAKSKTVEKLCAADIGLSPEQCGLRGSATKVVAMDAKFPGLRKGPKETDISTFVASLRKEAGL
ncbi:MAG: electron transfer flavoprotein subunit beta/FixA family protein [Oscillospiraceae bacterium]|nr:electron transfer flavoprotein subunit beta/FixA family protein [Oscillospiraceae bacterium]